MRCVLRLNLAVILSLAVCCQLSAQEKSVNPGINKQYEGNVNAEKYVGSFEVEGREAFARRKEIVAAMQLKPGMAVADVGAGTGLFTRLFAEAVGPQGTVYATDIQANFLDHILKTSHEAGLNNVKTVLSTADDSGLAPNSCDVVYVSDVYHHFEFPAKTMATIHNALRPGGRFVIVDYKRVEGRSTDFIYHHLRAGREVFEAEIKSFGFKLIDEPLFLRDNYMLRFEPFEVPPVPEEAKQPAGTGWPLDTPLWRVDCCAKGWALVDKRSAVRWPTSGWAALTAKTTKETVHINIEMKPKGPLGVRLTQGKAELSLEDNDGTLTMTYAEDDGDEKRVLGDLLLITSADRGGIIVPCREGLWIPVTIDGDFRRVFGTSEYEGCHMNMLGLIKSESALIVSWDDAYVSPELLSIRYGPNAPQQLTTNLSLRRTARTIRLTPLGSGDIDTVAAAYRQVRDKLAHVETIQQKSARNPHEELLIGAANVKLWTCLARKMDEDSEKEESVVVHWTFDEAAQIAEHLHNDLGLDRCLFTIGGWTNGGYDCRHPDILPANKECGGNQGLADAIKRIQKLGYVACLHDNYQDIYRNAASFSPDLVEKRADGSLVQGGRWLGGRAFIVCADKQVELAMRAQNMPEVKKLFDPYAYFIDTTFAAGPQECSDAKHPLDRNGDIAAKIRLSDEARKTFGLFGSEDGREWALNHSDFFEGIVGVGGKYFHTLDPATFSACVIPFWEMVYHDCQNCYGKYGYDAAHAAEFVDHHLLAARPLYYHSLPDHLYWKQPFEAKNSMDPQASFTRTDGGWAAGKHPLDAFLKNTQEILGPLNAATAEQRLERFEFLTSDGSVRRATYGQGRDMTTVVVNLGKADIRLSLDEGEVVLPQYGFSVYGPRIIAFYARLRGGINYPEGAMFAMTPRGGKTLGRASEMRIYHGFGPSNIRLYGSLYDVPGEKVVSVKRSRGIPNSR